MKTISISGWRRGYWESTDVMKRQLKKRNHHQKDKKVTVVKTAEIHILMSQTWSLGTDRWRHNRRVQWWTTTGSQLVPDKHWNCFCENILYLTMSYNNELWVIIQWVKTYITYGCGVMCNAENTTSQSANLFLIAVCQITVIFTGVFLTSIDKETWLLLNSTEGSVDCA